MSRRITIIQGHPDRSQQHFGHALTQEYQRGAIDGGHEVRMITVADIDFPLLRSQDDFYNGTPPPSIIQCQQNIRWADHVVISYPLWMGSMPALLKGFIEQVFRPGFAISADQHAEGPEKKLRGRSARIIVTMGMPAFFYRWFFFAHSLKSLERNILKFTGIRPIRESLIGMVEGRPAHRGRWLKKMHRLGQAGR